MCLVFIGIFRINPIPHRVELPNAQFAVSNADTTPSHFNHRNNLREIITNDKFAPTNSRKKNTMDCRAKWLLARNSKIS